jgi:hypothetical protein
MAVELGNQFKSVSSVGPTWVVQRIIEGPGIVPHAILTQTGDNSSIRTLSLSALEDTHMFERTAEAAPLAQPVAKKGTVRGFFRIAKKAAA